MHARLSARTTLIVAGLALSTSIAAAQDHLWLNPVDGNWSNPALWGPAGVPNGAGQSATINATGASYIVTLNMAATLDDFLLDSDDATLVFAGQTLTFNNQGVFNRGKARFNGGGLGGNTATNRSEFELTGTVAFALNSFLNEGDLTVLGGPGLSSTLQLGSTLFTNTGTITLNSTSNGGAAITGSGTLTNNGTINSFQGSGTFRTLTISTLDNNGDINISANTTFNGANGSTTTNASGSFNTTNGFTALFNTGHDFVLNGGTVNNLGGLEINGANAAFVFNGGTITGNNPRIVNAALITTAAGTGAVDMIGSTTLQSDAAPGLNINVLGSPGQNATMNMGASNFANNAIVNLDSTSNGGAAITGSGTLTNNGTINSLQGSGTARTLTIAALDNNGDININANTTFNGANGSTTTNAGATFNTTNGFTALFNTGHDFVLNGGTVNNLGGLEINGANAAFVFNGGTITGNNPRVVGAGLVTTAAGTGSIDMLGSTTLQSDAAPGLNINVLGSPGLSATMNMGASNLINNAVVALDSTSNGSATITGTGTFTNNGTINSLQGSGTARTLTIATLDNNGDINISANTTFNGANGSTTTNASGSFNTTNGFTSTFNSGHAFVLNGGTVNNEGAILITGTNSRLTLNAGDITGNAIEVRGGRLATTAPTTGGVMVTGTTVLETDLASGLTVSVAGAPGLSASLNMGSADITNHASLILTSTSNGAATLSGSGDFTNANSLSVLPGSGTSRTISVADFNNEGDFFAMASVSINLANGTFNNTGNLFIAPSAIVTIGGTGTQTLDNAVDGTIAGDGTLDLRFTEVFMNDGTFDPQGSLSVLGAWRQSDLGSLAIEIGGLDSGLTYDLLTVSLAAVLDGDLVVTLANGFNPSPTDVFTVLTASTVSGIFANGATTVQTADGLGTFDVLYNAGNVQLTNFVPVPTPASVAVLAMGGLVAARRRRA